MDDFGLDSSLVLNNGLQELASKVDSNEIWRSLAKSMSRIRQRLYIENFWLGFYFTSLLKI